MKQPLLLYLALLGAILLWPGCEDEDPPPPPCEFDVPSVGFSDGTCDPDPLRLNNLNEPQVGTFPTLPVDCPASERARIVRLDPSSDGQLNLHLYVGIPALINYQVFGADCDTNITPLTVCESSGAVAINQAIEDGADFSDIYVWIDYTIFDSPNYDNYSLGASDFIDVVAYDNEPKGNTISYSRSEGQAGPPSLEISCNGDSFQRLILSTCNPDADVIGWAQELGLPISESYTGAGGSVVAVDVPSGMSPDFFGGGGGEDPVTSTRRPKQDSTELFVEQDYLITVPTTGAGIIDLVQSEYKFPIGSQDCITFEPGTPSSQAENVIVTVIDSGVEFGGVWDGTWEDHRYRLPNSGFVQQNSLGYDFIRDDAQPDDEIGHGTAVGGLVIGGYRGDAPLTVVHFKIFGGEGFATYFGAVVATNEAVNLGSHIINMSWGIPQPNEPLALGCAIRRAGDRGAIVVTTAGNNNVNIDEPMNTQWPGSFGLQKDYEHLFTVASMEYPDQDLSREPVLVDLYSNFSDKRVNVAAYLTGLSPKYGAATPTEFSTLAGTSISAPLISRDLARYLGANGGNVGDWRSERLRTSSDLEVSAEVARGLYLPLCIDITGE
ncbi:S8 family serine peptidase [Lewinella sp. W8]|uniref:S8 family peptidase n=1 Tax=Lewinella sp. W8 TaxID=2528208 RepID=UPI001067B0BD|nr:S8 family serine peptidase [Lewinella sp. W8]MTB52372.1 S8 family serine peptidase [Lewinella sp. W8]